MKTIVMAAIIATATAGDDEFKKKVKDLGFDSEQHAFMTNDHYILTMGRILPKEKTNPPVLLLPDVFMSMDSWLLHAETAD